MAGIVQAEGCKALTNCIGGAETGQSEVTTIRVSPGFYTLAAGEKSGPSELYAIIATDGYESEDLSSTTDADLNRRRHLHRPFLRRGLNGKDRLLQDDFGIPVDAFISGTEALKTDLIFAGLRIDVTVVKLDPECEEDESCLDDTGVDDVVRLHYCFFLL